ncbi:dynamin family protein [Niallia taxi]|uniref:dynamin family protein n=1 Tax=Niallia taxi TaxID=2499688 RepID=UPI00398283FB
MSINQDERSIANELIDVFSKKETIKRYFQSDIDWLNDRLSIWKNNYIRVGLVGVTSSGKSTLLNAILGEDILPTAVRPSSGTLITCSKGPKVEARVHFENGKSKLLSEKNLKEELQKYGDENFNKNNNLKVKIIDVTSPYFLFPETVQIIDSPGLDAHGLERHEQITMELLLPTVDFCMYVVTLKANSDSVTHTILHTIYEHQKPLIIVQNMLDSVEAKVGKNGVLIKSRYEVAAEHKLRVERVLKLVHEDLPKIVDVVQLSAKHAVDGRRKQNKQMLHQSQIPQLIQLMEKRVIELMPKLYIERTTQIYHHLTSIQDKEEMILSDMNAQEQMAKEQQSELDQFKKDQVKTNLKVAESKRILNKKIINLETATNNAINRIKSLSRRDLSACKQILDQVKQETKTIESDFIISMRSLNNVVKQLLDSLNLQTKDYENDLAPTVVSSNAQHFSVKRKIKKESYQVKKSGIGGKIGRFFGKVLDNDWGYTTKDDEYEVLDVEAISRNLKDYQEKFTGHMEGYISQWEGRAESFLFRAREEIQRRTDSFTQKSNNLLEKQEIVEILFLLKGFIIRLEEGSQKAKKTTFTQRQKQQERKQSLEKIAISEEIFGLYQLGHYLLSLPSKKCWDEVQKRNEQKCGKHTRTLIWGWDSTALIQFAQRHAGIQFIDKEEKQLESSGLILSGKNKEIILVNEGKLHPEIINGLKELTKSGHYNLYMLLNLIQIGAAEKALKNSILLTMNHITKLPVNFVVQSFTELKNADRVEEGIHTLYEKLNEWDIFKKGEVLINDKNPIYSMICLELSEEKTILVDAQEVLLKVKQNYQHLLAAPYEEEYIRAFVRALIDAKRGVLK